MRPCRSPNGCWSRFPSDVNFAAELAKLNAPPDAKDAADPSTESKKQIDEAVRNSVKQEVNRNYAEAIQAILGEYSAHPQDYLLNLRMGWLYYLSGSYDNSAQHYYTALQITPQSTEAGVGYLLPLLAQARYPDAESFVHEIVKGDPKNYYGNLRLAVALRLQGKYADAEQVVAPMPRGLSRRHLLPRRNGDAQSGPEQESCGPTIILQCAIARSGKCYRQTADPPTVTGLCAPLGAISLLPTHFWACHPSVPKSDVVRTFHLLGQFHRLGPAGLGLVSSCDLQWRGECDARPT